jgi:hypothetical protein
MTRHSARGLCTSHACGLIVREGLVRACLRGKSHVVMPCRLHRRAKPPVSTIFLLPPLNFQQNFGRFSGSALPQDVGLESTSRSPPCARAPEGPPPRNDCCARGAPMACGATATVRVPSPQRVPRAWSSKSLGASGAPRRRGPGTPAAGSVPCLPRGRLDVPALGRGGWAEGARCLRVLCGSCTPRCQSPSCVPPQAPLWGARQKPASSCPKETVCHDKVSLCRTVCPSHGGDQTHHETLSLPQETPTLPCHTRGMKFALSGAEATRKAPWCAISGASRPSNHVTPPGVA